MSPLSKKLNLKDQKQLLITGAPDSFLPEMKRLLAVNIDTDILQHSAPDFVLCFVKSCEELQNVAAKVLPIIQGDIVLWFAYPKKSSKKYSSDISRDSGWQILGEAGYEAVRQVAIDEDWSALRFRRAELINRLARSEKHAMSTVGKQRTRHKS